MIVVVLRVSTAESSFDGARAPSTVGSWLRAPGWSDLRQLDASGATACWLSEAPCE